MTVEAPPQVSAAEANREHYDATAKEYDHKHFALEGAAKAAQSILSRSDHFVLGEKIDVMDYACGTGAISESLQFNAHSILAQKMVDEYNSKFQSRGVNPSRLRAVAADLQRDPSPLEGRTFDVIVCAQAYHHFDSIEQTTQTLAKFLKPEGELLVVDFASVPFSTSEHLAASQAAAAGLPRAPPEHTVPHQHGFDQSTMRNAFEGAGLGDFSYRHAFTQEIGGKELPYFIALGVKGA